MMSIHAKVAAFIFLSLLLAGCVRPPPPMGRDLPANFNAANPAFDQRIKVHYPVGIVGVNASGRTSKGGFHRHNLRLHCGIPVLGAVFQIGPRLQDFMDRFLEHRR
jgi:hypothetical protein